MKRLIKRILSKIGFRKKSESLFNGNVDFVPLNQELGIYYSEEFAKVLDTWGIGTVWDEIQFLFVGRKGKVLDIACGTGKVIQILEKFSELEIIGCDISELLINKAIDKGIHSNRLVIGDATKLNFEDNAFDYSYSIGSLEHFTERGISEFINEAYRVTKRISMHNIPVSKSGENMGWINRTQSYFNNSNEWWLEKFSVIYNNIIVLDSKWNDDISCGKWFICFKDMN
ncbi:MAG: class I SAM-dependent methyltransferase [Bacteroidetes bacterium]|nr:class I SAM-dependent methyltransferase [Bacteroidota bacterium]